MLQGKSNRRRSLKPPSKVAPAQPRIGAATLRTIADASCRAAVEAQVQANRLLLVAQRDELWAEAAEMLERRRGA